MSTYGDVKTEFKALLNRRDATPTQITTFLQNSIRRIQRNLRVPAMERGMNVTVEEGFTAISIPSDYLEIIRITNSAGTELDRRDISTVMAVGAQGPGRPRIYTRRGPTLLLAPPPAEGDTVRIDYYAELTPLEADEDENLLTLVASDLIVYGALTYACRHFHDKRLADFEAIYAELFASLTDQADRDELAGGAVVSAAHFYPSDD